MSKLARACLRCIERKRKCDHVHPQCGTCTRASVVCEYPLPQHRRGPLGGFSRTAEDRALAAEDALAWLLSKPEVQELLETLDDALVVPQSQERTLSKESRVKYWTKHRLNTVADLRAYPKDTSPPLRNNEAVQQRSKSREETMSSGDASQSGDESDADMSAINPHDVVPQSGLEQLCALPMTTHQDAVPGPPTAHGELYDPSLQTYDQSLNEGTGAIPTALSPGPDIHRHPHQASQRQHYPPLQPTSYQPSYTPKLDELAAWAGRLPSLDRTLSESVMAANLQQAGPAPEESINKALPVPDLRTGREEAQPIATTAMTDLFW